ncbi:hypothetical protein E2C01_086813 [Portunus trituberculatus]|uniref:Uncharacterized protein n=1 Tax=Portunus trituberculatus TaxID=210409 RepID=A0A5B7JCF6_PORTR|nr:hypothetical protein [Portunus trituberculatus]
MTLFLLSPGAEWIPPPPQRSWLAEAVAAVRPEIFPVYPHSTKKLFDFLNVGDNLENENIVVYSSSFCKVGEEAKEDKDREEEDKDENENENEEDAEDTE